MACPGLGTYTLAGLCALWLERGSSTASKLQHSAKPQPHQTSCPARPQHPVQAPVHLLHTAEPAFDLAVAHASAQGWPLTHWQGSVRCGCRAAPTHLENSSSIQQNRTPHKPPAQPGRSTQCRPHSACCTLQRLHLTLQCPMACPGLANDTPAGLCVPWLPSGASTS